MAKKLPRYKVFHLFTKFDMCLFTTLEDWNLAMNQNDLEQFYCDDTDIGRCMKTPTNDNKMSFNMYIPVKHFTYGTVIHESTHMVDFLMEYIGINDIEFRAYMVEDLSVRIIENLRKELQND